VQSYSFDSVIGQDGSQADLFEGELRAGKARICHLSVGCRLFATH